MIGVYIKVNKNNEIYAVHSDIFITNFEGWIKIDEGAGDKYALAQGNYFDKSLIDDDGYYNYRYENGQVIERV